MLQADLTSSQAPASGATQPLPCMLSTFSASK